MRLFTSLFSLLLIACVLLLSGCGSASATTTGQPSATAPSSAAGTHVSNVQVLGMVPVPFNAMAFNAPIGGLSAIAYDQANKVYFFLSDDRAAHGPVRIYKATVNLSDGKLDDGDLTWTGIIPLMDATGAPFALGAIDPEGLVLTGKNFYVSTEGDTKAEPPIAPAILEFTPNGEFVASLPLPEQFIQIDKGKHGVRDNQGFESLTMTPDGRYLISGVQNALEQDGPKASLKKESPARLIEIDLNNDSAIKEPVYMVDAIPVAPKPEDGDADNGLTELLALDNNGTLLALERSYAEGVGNTVRLYQVEMQGATDVSTLDTLKKDESLTPVAKQRVADFGELGSALGFAPDNLEGMAFGPQLPDGRQVLLVVSDNNFNPEQTTQLWALALKIDH